MIDQFSSALIKIKEKLVGWVDSAFFNLPNFIISILIVGIGWALSKYVYRLVHRFLWRFSKNVNVANLGGSVSRVLVVGAALFAGLSVLGLSGLVASGLAGAGIVGLALGFALQEPLANLFAGVLMSVKELYKMGDLIETNGHTGVIQKISLRNTLVKTFQGLEVAIPNKDVLQHPLVNYTKNDLRRIDIPIGVSYGDDLDYAKKIAVQEVRRSVSIAPETDVKVYWTSFGDSAINGVLNFWVSRTAQQDFLASRSEAIVAIKRIFDRQDISIPFPIRTLDFGIKGGVSLKEMKEPTTNELQSQLAFNT